MLTRRLAALCVAFAFLAGASHSLNAQDKKKDQPKKLSKQEQQDVQTLVKLADAAMAGQPGPTEIPARPPASTSPVGPTAGSPGGRAVTGSPGPTRSSGES